MAFRYTHVLVVAVVVAMLIVSSVGDSEVKDKAREVEETTESWTEWAKDKIGINHPDASKASHKISEGGEYGAGKASDAKDKAYDTASAAKDQAYDTATAAKDKAYDTASAAYEAAHKVKDKAYDAVKSTQRETEEPLKHKAEDTLDSAQGLKEKITSTDDEL